MPWNAWPLCFARVTNFSPLVIPSAARNLRLIARNQYYVYLLTNKHQTVLYAGVTNDLGRRMWEHKNRVVPGFTSRYNIDRLMYFEVFRDVTDAIAREKQIKGWTRAKKIALLESANPTWRDLSGEWD